MNFLNKRKYLILAAIIFVGFFIWRSIKSQESKYEEYTVKKGDITETLALSGEIAAKKQANLHFQAGGLVTYYPWKEGDTIKQYTTVASLDQRQLKKTLEKYLNLYAKERHDFDQTQDDYETSITLGNIDQELRRILESAQYDLDNSVIDVELQDLSLQLSRLYAPFEGILISSPISSPHVNILATDNFVIVDPNSLYFSADLDEGDLSRVNSSLPVFITLDAYPDLKTPSSISKISYSCKETSTGTTYEVELSLPAEILDKLRLGLNGEANIVIAEKSAILILPIETVKEKGDSSYVLIKNNGKVEEIEIETGISDNTYIEIITGLSEGDRVVTEK